MGSGVLRAHPSLLRHYSYKSLIDNTIKFKLLDDVSDKSGKFYTQNLKLLYNKISKQEEIESVRWLEKELKWSGTERILSLAVILTIDFRKAFEFINCSYLKAV